MSRRVLLVATRSIGKLRELVPLLSPLGAALLTLDEAGIARSDLEERLEEFATFEENALTKARYFARVSELPTVADDSGLEVFALGGRPGVHSKRWSGRTELEGEALDEANRGKLLDELRNKTDRRARYCCAAAFVGGGREMVICGETRGEILRAARGSGGFGYDSLFLSDELGLTFAEARSDEKERVSHRGRAFAELVESLRGEPYLVDLHGGAGDIF